MTLIFGVNLSDRVYLSADTRLTKRDAKNNFLYFDDNFAKIVPLSENKGFFKLIVREAIF